MLDIGAVGIEPTLDPSVTRAATHTILRIQRGCNKEIYLLKLRFLGIAPEYISSLLKWYVALFYRLVNLPMESLAPVFTGAIVSFVRI